MLDKTASGIASAICPSDSPLVHELHAHANVRLVEVGAVEADDVFRVTFVKDLQFAEDLFAHDWFGVDEDGLWVREERRRLVR